MPLLLTEADVKALLTMPLALEAVEASFQHLAEGQAVLQYRQRLHVSRKGVLNHMAAADLVTGYMGLKIYSISRTGARFVVTLFSADSGDLVALIEADYLGQMRTAAASGVATRLMAREDARIAAIIGTGLQARTQIEALAAVRKLDGIRAFGRDAGRREAFAREMSARLGVPVTAVSSAEEAVCGAQIVTTCTTSKVPVLEGRWLEPGMHLNAVGVNQAQKRELDTDAVLRCGLIAADSREQSKIEAGDLIQAFAGDASHWEFVREFAEIEWCRHRGRRGGRQNL
jgi:ornithine cyclodeaminase/alanine dehydrogenase-like protein (mu-crystallin family)